MKERHLLVVAPPESLEEISSVLESTGAHLGRATSGPLAMEMLERGGWEFVLCSSQLPGDQCREVCELLAEFSVEPPHVVVLVSPSETDAEKIRAQHRADAVLRLPLAIEALQQLVRLLDEQRSLRQQIAILREENRLLGEKLAKNQPSSGRMVRFEIFRDVLAAEVKKAQRYGYPLSLLVMAVDHYRELAGWLSENQRRQFFEGFFDGLARSTRDIDIAVMLAEDKLLVLMPHTQLEGAAVVADRIRARVAASKAPASLRQLRITVSISVAATGGGDQIKFGEMVGRAMRGLQEAEAKGGDAVMVCPATAPSARDRQNIGETGQLGERIFFL